MNLKYIFLFPIAITLIVLGSLDARGQKRIDYDLAALTENHKLTIYNREINSFSENGKKGIRFSAGENDGVAWLDGLLVGNCIIELDIRGKDIIQQSFVGIAFHGVDEKILDAIYFRPFNFQSSDPVRKIHAVQYVSHPEYSWNRLREDYNGKYEKAVTPPPKPTDWFHVKIVLKYPLLRVYVDNGTEPSLMVEQLNNRKSGKIGFWVGNNSDGDFSNLQITPLD